jgi:hypothetical protein
VPTSLEASARLPVVALLDGVGNHDLSCSYFSRSSRLYSSLTAFREICPLRVLAICRRSGSVGARDFRLNLTKSLAVGEDALPNSRSNHPMMSSPTGRNCDTITMNLGVKRTARLHLSKNSQPRNPQRVQAGPKQRSSNVGYPCRIRRYRHSHDISAPGHLRHRRELDVRPALPSRADIRDF